MTTQFRNAILAVVLAVQATSTNVWSQPDITHQTQAAYSPGGFVMVTNHFSYTGQLLSFLWRPRLPAGWTLISATGDGGPESRSGEIVLTGNLPPSPINLIYTVRAAFGEIGSKEISGEVEYQFEGAANPTTQLAAPEPLILQLSAQEPGGATIGHESATHYSPGGEVSVTNRFHYTGQLLSLLWRPRLPAGWTLVSVSGDANPETRSGEIVWTGILPASPINLIYRARVPYGETGTKEIRGEVEFLFSGLTNPTTHLATPSPLVLDLSAQEPGGASMSHQTAAHYSAGGVVSVTNRLNYTGQLLSLLWRPRLPSGWTLISSSGDGSPEARSDEIVWVGSLPASPINLVYTVRVPRVEAGSKQIGGEVEFEFLGMTNPATQSAAPGPLVLELSGQEPGGVSILHESASDYSAGGGITVTNHFSYAGQLLSLLWRPRLPAGWALTNVSGDGNPEMNLGEIVWTGSLPASSIRLVYTVAIPEGESGSKPIRGEVEFQFADEPNPLLAFASPDALTVSSVTAPTSVRISGLVRYYAENRPLPGVAVNAANVGGSTAANAMTDGAGVYEVMVNAQGSYTTAPAKSGDSPVSQGVSTFDITLIRRHILGLTALGSPYKLIAADVSNSSSVTTLDITLMRRLILGITTTFPAGLWKFVRSDFVFANPLIPWSYESTRSYAELQADVIGQDFIGIKLGDANGSWQAAAGGQVTVASVGSSLWVERETGGDGFHRVPEISRSNGTDALFKEAVERVPSTSEITDPGSIEADRHTPGLQTLGSSVVTISTGGAVVASGNSANVSVKVTGFTQATSAQFTLQWDPTVLQFLGLGNYGLPGLADGNFGTTLTESGISLTGNGTLTFSWEDPSGLGATLTDDSVIFTIQFKAIGARGTSSAVALRDQPTIREVAVGLQTMDVLSQNGTVFVGEENLAPAMAILRLDDGRIRLQLIGPAGRNYRLQGSANLKDWIPLLTTHSVSGHIEFMDAESANSQRRFYRLMSDQ